MTAADHLMTKRAHRGLRRRKSRADGNGAILEHDGDRHRRNDRGVVSSVVAAGLVLWINERRQKSDGERRLTFYAPAEPVGARQRPDGNAPLRRPAPVRIRPPTNAQALLQRADIYLRSGKPGEARIVLEQAAQLGSGVAALTLGAMYDPGRATQFSNLEIKADPTLARAGTSAPRTSASLRQTIAWQNSPRDERSRGIGSLGPERPDHKSSPLVWSWRMGEGYINGARAFGLGPAVARAVDRLEPE